jgi:hypothetical protein
VPQERALNVDAAIPTPLMFITALEFVEELLAIVITPVKFQGYAPEGLKLAVNLTVCPGFSVSGVVTPLAPKSDPATEMDEIVTGALPAEDSVRD